MADAVATPTTVTAPAGAPAPSAPAPTQAPAPAQTSEVPAPWSAPTPAKAEEAKPAEQKPAEQKPAEIKYELKLPKDSYMDPASVEKFTSWVKERGLTNEQAQAILERNHEERKELVESSISQLKKQNADWLGALKNDKDFGGANYEANANHAKAAFDRFDKDGMFRKALREGHMDNHPLLVKFAAAVGKAFAEDKVSAPTLSAPGRDSRDPVTKLKDLYAAKGSGKA